MSLIKCLTCFILIILTLPEKCELKVSLTIINVPGVELKRDLRQNTVRDKYGEACLKVAIRKCFKALQDVSKNVCRRNFRCNSNFKSDFKKSSKTGCLEEFDYSRIKKTNNNQKYVKRGNFRFSNAARERFIDTCIPHMVPQYKKNNNESLRNDVLQNLIERLLRSSSERDCQKLSRDKCKKACNYAKNEVCKKHACSSRRKRAFRNTCKRECRQEYIVRKRYSRSSSDSD